MISVTMVAPFTYEVAVEYASARGDENTARGDEGAERTYRVRLSQDYYMKLSQGAFTHEWVIVQAFQFLLDQQNLDQQNKGALEAEFALSDIGRRFPDFEAEIDARLNRRR